MDTEQLKEIIKSGALIVQYLWPLLAPVVGLWVWFTFFRKKEQRLFKNIQREIAVLGTKARPMGHEVKLLRRSGLFNVDEPETDTRSLDFLKDKRLLILGYTPGMKDFQKVVEAARANSVPLIVYAGPRDITDEHMPILQSYTYHTMCNTPLRLISDVFAIMSTMPEKNDS